MKISKVIVQTNYIDSLRRAESNGITGILYCDFDDYQFPEKEWNDFVVVVLGWWLKALVPFVTGEVDQAKLRFMDGPFALYLERLNEGQCRIDCMDSSSHDRPEYSCEANIEQLFENVLKTAKETHFLCVEKGWVDTSVETLGAYISDCSKKAIS